MPTVRPQLRADNLKCSAECPNALFGAARFAAQYVRSLGQDVSPGKCVLLSTSKAVRRVMKYWDVSGDGKAWKGQLDVRDLGGHLDITRRARSGTLTRGLKKLRLVTLRLVPCLLGFRSSWGWCEESISLLICMLLRHLMFLLLPLAPSGQLL